MKKRFLYLTIVGLSIISNNVCSQNTPDTSFRSIFPRNEENKVEYVKVVEVDSLSKKEISLRIKEWAINNFNSQKAALQSEDLETGYMLYQATKTNTYNIPKGWGFAFIGSKVFTITTETKFSINFYIKDNKFKIVVNNITDRYVSANGVWYEVVRTTTGEKAMDEPPTTIEDAGLFPLSEYFKQPDDNKYIVRLNFSAKLWRGIDSEIKNLLESVNSIVAVKKKSPFDF
ncbi:MAG: DUF4468 domain-containing protein [Bacteroidetes bacterium]|jgi:hypothetical protein|nr:DUF4468 domain-containing protein [Bacteroidota bacterium]